MSEEFCFECHERLPFCACQIPKHVPPPPVVAQNAGEEELPEKLYLVVHRINNGNRAFTKTTVFDFDYNPPDTQRIVYRPGVRRSCFDAGEVGGGTGGVGEDIRRTQSHAASERRAGLQVFQSRLRMHRQGGPRHAHRDSGGEVSRSKKKKRTRLCACGTRINFSDRGAHDMCIDNKKTKEEKKFEREFDGDRRGFWKDEDDV